ncbi:MAG: serine hydroxymethyltransferase [Armatimonadota bacterium]
MIEHTLAHPDPEMARILEAELERQRTTLVMIPSENYASEAVLAVSGCVMTNKYAEGYPGKRWYNGCQFVDAAEQLAIDRAKALFKCEHANVQPHTGASANMAAYYALLDDGDTILGMSVDHGGHLTHGSHVNFSGRRYHCVAYGVSPDTERIDPAEVAALAREHKPKLIVVGASAYPRLLDFQEFRAIADDVGAYLLADIAHIVGLIVAAEHPDPVPHCEVVTSTTHKTLRGPRGALILCREEHATDVDRAVFPGTQAGPLMHVIAAKAVAFKEAQSDDFARYQRQIIRNARALAEGLLREGFRLVSGGTDNHLMLVDLRPQGINGKDAADLLEEAGICVNKNLIPFDPGTPMRPSGIRPGTPAVTSRGMREPEMAQIATWIARVIRGRDDATVRARVREEVRELCEQFPVYEAL